MENIGKNLKKEYWKRRTTGDNPSFPLSSEVNYVMPEYAFGENFRYLTQNDFLNEIEQGAHKINGKYYSKRPVWELVSVPDERIPSLEKKEWKIVRYDDVEIVPLGLQKRFARSFASHFAADGFRINNETTDSKRYETFCSWKDSTGLNTAWMELVLSCAQTGDGAIYIYQRGSNIEYKVYSYLYGDTLYTYLDENGNNVVCREYSLNGRRAVDRYFTTKIETWAVVNHEDKEEEEAFQSYIKSVHDGNITTKEEYSEDGFKLIFRKETQLDKETNQCIYVRIDDIVSGCVQDSIESLERTCSYMSEEVKSSAFPILMLKATKLTSLPPIGAHGKTIGVKGNSEDVKNADAKFLTKQDMSNIATATIKTITDNIMHSSMQVFIEPEILKSGADSSSTIKILFTPIIQLCQTMWVQFFKPAKEITEVFKGLVGKLEGDGEGYHKLRTSIEQIVWIPQNESELIENTCKMTYAGVLSRKNARTMVGSQYMDDEKIINQEQENDLYIKTFIPIKAKSEAEAAYGTPVNDKILVDDTTHKPNPDEPKHNTGGDNPYKPGLDNNLPMKGNQR